MTELEKLAQWHDEQASQKDCTGWLYDRHTDAAATIRAAVAEIERLREALQLADYTLRGCNMNLRVVERKVSAALAAQAKGHDNG